MKKSLTERIVRGFLEAKKKLSREETEAELAALKERGPVETPIPLFPETRVTDSANGRIFYANEDSVSNITVFYIHGDGFEHDFSPFHWMFIDKIIAETDAEVIAPAYLLVPFGTWKQAFVLILPVYGEYAALHPEKKIVLMGDSAGGGLALSIAEQIKITGLRIPDELILLSPWVDTAMENPALNVYAEKDPWLSKEWLEVCAKAWADGLDLHDYRVSPIFGDFSGFKRVTVTAGTMELFYPDIVKFCASLDKSETSELIVGENLIHVYPLIPMRDAEKARAEIISVIRRK